MNSAGLSTPWGDSFMEKLRQKLKWTLMKTAPMIEQALIDIHYFAMY